MIKREKDKYRRKKNRIEYRRRKKRGEKEGDREDSFQPNHMKMDYRTVLTA